MQPRPDRQQVLDDQFGIPGVATVAIGRGGLTKITVSTPAATGEMYLHGGQVTSWRPAGANTDVLFVSREALWQPGRAIRGGIPVCFPWFGAHPSNPKAPSHGFVRLREWQLESIQQQNMGVVVTVGTSSDASTRELFPHEFHLRLRVTFGPSLNLSLTATNTGDEPFAFEEALHTYFSVNDILTTTVSGLDGVGYLDTVGGLRQAKQHDDVRFESETDRIYVATGEACTIHDAAGGRRITVQKSGARSTVVWNPWVARAKALADFGDDEWTRMLCVETANVRDAAIVLPPGQSHTATATIRCD